MSEAENSEGVKLMGKEEYVGKEGRGIFSYHNSF